MSRSGPLDDLIGRSITDRIAVGPRAGQKLAGLLLTTEVMIAEAPKEEEHSHGAPGGMGGMGGMDM